MNDTKKTARKMKGGAIAAIVIAVLAMLTLGVGLAMAAVNQVSLVDVFRVRNDAVLMSDATQGDLPDEVELFAESINDEIDVEIHVVWDDNDDALGLRPDAVTVMGYQYPNLSSSSPYTSVKTDISITDDGTGTWSGNMTLDKKDPDGNDWRDAYIYPGALPNAYTYITHWEGSQDGLIRGIEGDILTLTLSINTKQLNPDSPKKDVAISVVWDDNNNADGGRPSYLRGHLTDPLLGNYLTDGGYESLSITPDENGVWGTVIASIPSEYYGGAPITSYSVNGFSAPSGYNRSVAVSEDGTSIVLTYQEEMVNFDITVLWEDGQSPTRPDELGLSLVCQSYDSQYYNQVVESATARKADAIVDGDAWTVNNLITNVPKLQYGWNVEVPDGYTLFTVQQTKWYSVDDEPPYQLGYKVVLVKDELLPPTNHDIVVNIDWDDKEDYLGLRPDYVDVVMGYSGEYGTKRVPLGDAWEGSHASVAFEDIKVYEVSTYNSDANYVPTYRTSLPPISVQFPAGYEQDKDNYNTNYWLSETKIPTSSAGIITDYTLTETFHLNRKNAALVVNWEDGGNTHSSRPESLTVGVVQSTARYGTQEECSKVISGSGGADTWECAVIEDADGLAVWTDATTRRGETSRSYLYAREEGHDAVEYQYDLSVADVDGYNKSDITAIEDGTYSITFTYVEPEVPQPETVAVSITRSDESEGIEPTAMTLTEVMPDGLNVDTVDTTLLAATVSTPGQTPATYDPTADAADNALVYSFSMANGSTLAVPLIKGSQVRLVNGTPDVALTQTVESDSTQEGQTFTVGDVADTPLSITVRAASVPAPAPTLTVHGSVANAESAYEAYKVFGAVITEDEGTYKGSNFTWNEAAKPTVLAYIKDASRGYDVWLATTLGKDAADITDDDRNEAQNAAGFIAAKIADSDEDTVANTTPKTTKGDTFATGLATALRNAGISPVSVPEGTATDVEQGYYLVATATSTIGDGEAGTAPVWVAVPAAGIEVNEKATVPSFNKQVKDNTDDEAFGKVADASTGQWLDFRITATLPDNLAAYPAYGVSVSDVIPATMEGTLDGFKVEVAGDATTDITDKVAKSLESGTLSVSVANVLDADTLGVAVKGGDEIVISYKARLTASAVKGSTGNDNTATLTYSADPLVSSTRATMSSTAKVLTYQVRLDKVDNVTRQPLDGAKFTAKTEIGGTDYFVKEDGSLTADESEAFEFTTAGGSLLISGIDEGTYVLTEVEAPSGYERISLPLTVVLDATKNQTAGTLTSLTAEASGANGTLVSDPTEDQDGVVSTATETGLAVVRISDIKQIVLPLTGMTVKQAGTVAAVLIAIVSVAAIVVRKREDEE